jgi:anaerobic sulfite reductase subunit B
MTVSMIPSRCRVMARNQENHDTVRVSLEYNRRRGVATCGRCQLGPLLVRRDGPVVTYDRAAQLFAVREL